MASHKRRPVRALVTLTVAIVAACAALAIGHFTKDVSPYPDLALDLKGGTQLILTPTVTGACAIGTAAASVALIAWAPQLTTSSGLSASVALCPRREDGPPDCAPD